MKTSQNSTNNLHNSSPSINILWSEKLCVLARNKSIIISSFILFFYINGCFRLKTSPLSIKLLSPMKHHLIWIRIEICTDQAMFINQNSSKQIRLWILMLEQQRMKFLTLRNDNPYYRLWTNSTHLKLKCLNDGFAHLNTAFGFIRHQFIFLSNVDYFKIFYLSHTQLYSEYITSSEM